MTRGESPQALSAVHRRRVMLHSGNRELGYRAANRAPVNAPVWNRREGGRVETPRGMTNPFTYPKPLSDGRPVTVPA